MHCKVLLSKSSFITFYASVIFCFYVAHVFADVDVVIYTVKFSCMYLVVTYIETLYIRKQLQEEG